MAVTRIKNNQVTDASGANTQLGINANTKIQNFSITSGKLANNLTYGSDLTITGNLTVQGTSTAIDTTITTIEDPIIILASTQTSGAPAVDIGFLGFRGNQSNIAFVWDESAGSFVTAFTSTAESNTTITITSLANLQVGNLSLTGNTLGPLNVTGNIAGGNLLTPGLISATSTITSAANITGGNVLTGGLVSATGNITGGNVLTGGLVSATANVTGGNILTAGLISATSTITSAANVTGSNLITTGGTFTGTLDTTGNAIVGGNLIVQGNITYINIDDLRVEDPIIILGTGPNGAPLTVNDGKDRGVFMEYFITAGNTLANAFMGYDNSSGNMILATTATIANDVITVTAFGTLQAGNLNIESAVSSGNITGGNLLTAGLISATSTITSAANITGGNILTGGLVSATANVTGGNLLTGGLVTATGNITGANLILTSGTIDGPAAGRVTINASDIDTDFAVDGDTLANVFYVDAGTGTASFGASTQVTNAIVNFSTTNSIKVPVGNTAQRPATGVTGMLRFNTTTNSLEVFDNTAYAAVGVPVFTVIADEQFNGDGSTVAFTLASTQTTNSCIVSINGVVQVPSIAYSVSGTNPTCVLTFTEAPISGDLIDVREITTTTSVTQISNGPGNAIIAVTDTEAQINITGNIIPTSDVTFDLGSANLRWNDLYLAGNSIVLGNTVIKNTSGNSIGFFGPDGTTAATIDAASVDTTTIANGTSNVKVVSANGNVTTNVNGTSNVMVISSTGSFITGVNSVTGNVTGGNVLTAGLISATSTITSAANITGGNVLTGGLVSATGNITGGNVLTGGFISATGNITGNLITGTLTTASQTAITSVGTLGSLTVSGNITPGGIAMSTANATIGNLFVTGTTTISGNITQVSGNTGQFFGNASTGFNALYAGLSAGFTILPQSVVNFVTQSNSYSQVNTQNQSAGDESTVDLVLTGDNGNDSTFFFDIGYTGSGYDPAVAVLNNALGNVVTPNDAYMYTTGNVAASDPSNMVIGTVDTNSYVRFFVGGYYANAIVMQLNAPNAANTVTITGGISATGNVQGGNIRTAGLISATGAITGASLTVSTGNVSCGNIINTNANGVGNIGSTGTRFNQVFALASSAQYADLAEKYTADATYATGTVVAFGGDQEVTISAVDSDRRVAGVISALPSFRMNDGLQSEHTAMVALTGRVPTLVTGTVRKGDMMVSAGAGRARAEADPAIGTVIGKSLADHDGVDGVIEVVVGRV